MAISIERRGALPPPQEAPVAGSVDSSAVLGASLPLSLSCPAEGVRRTFAGRAKPAVCRAGVRPKRTLEICFTRLCADPSPQPATIICSRSKSSMLPKLRRQTRRYLVHSFNRSCPVTQLPLPDLVGSRFSDLQRKRESSFVLLGTVPRPAEAFGPNHLAPHLRQSSLFFEVAYSRN